MAGRGLRHWRAAAAIGLGCALAGGSAARGRPVVNADPPFTAEVPDDFAPVPAITAKNPASVQAFRRTAADGAVTLVVFDRLRATIGRERMGAGDMPAGSAVHLYTTAWHGFTVDGFEAPEQVRGTAMVNYNVQVPIEPFAVQVCVSGRRDHAAELRALSETILAHLDGPTNWLASAAPPAVAASPRYGTVIAATMLSAVVVGIAGIWLLHRRAGRGAALAVAVALYAGSYAFGPGVTREARGAIGVVRLVGFVGGVIGLYDLFRHPDRRREPIGPGKSAEPPPLPPRVPPRVPPRAPPG